MIIINEVWLIDGIMEAMESDWWLNGDRWWCNNESDNNVSSQNDWGGMMIESEWVGKIIIINNDK